MDEIKQLSRLYHNGDISATQYRLRLVAALGRLVERDLDVVMSEMAARILLPLN